MTTSRDPMAMAGAYLQAVGMVEAGPEHREYGLLQLQELARMGHIKAGWRLADELVRDPPAKFNNSVAEWALAAYRTGHGDALERHLDDLRHWGRAAVVEELRRQRRDIDLEAEAAANEKAARIAAGKARADEAKPAPPNPQPPPAAAVAAGGFVGFLANPGYIFVLGGLAALFYVLIWYEFM